MDIRTLLAHPAVQRARSAIHNNDAHTLQEQLELVQIPAPPFDEEERGRHVRARFAEIGLAGITTDEVGNVVARLPGNGSGRPVVLSAHLDTVFPAGTDLTVRQEGERIYVPGIADNTRGLAVMLAVARTLCASRLVTRAPLYIVATVGEEGIGDLRGVKHLFREESPFLESAAFVSIDGSGIRRIVHRAVGSRRLRITVEGPGGHSWSDWGLGNPVHALGRAIAEFATLPVPAEPRTTLTTARIGGGKSVNAIPQEAWAEMDLRSENAAALAETERSVRRIVEHAIEVENLARQREGEPLRVAIEVIGDRPAGEIPAGNPVVRTARALTRALGAEPELVASSTDANTPISLGIPAITIGAGGSSGGIHTTEEWYSNQGGALGAERALLLALALAGLAD